MWVVKLGGSLQGTADLKGWLGMLAEYGAGRVVLVPGGGKFAELVRTAQAAYRFDDAAAHAMAVAAMEQYARLLCAIEPSLRAVADRRQLEQALAERHTALWFPAEMVLAQSDLPKNWDITSDSLALWLAAEISAQALILVKSVPLPATGRSVPELAEHGLIDRYFPRLFSRKPVTLAWMRGTEPSLLQTALVGGTLPPATLLRPF